MRIRPRRAQHIVFPLATFALLASHTSAQTDLPGLTDLSSVINGGPSTTTTTNAGSTTTRPSPSAITPTTNPSATATAEPTTNTRTTTTITPSTTTAQQSTTPTRTTAAPNLTSTPSLSSSSILQVLTGSLPPVIGATIPTPVIPDTSLAPFMQKSSLPEGTVFIAVGAILGFLGMSILAWRGLVAWSLHRSVKRSAGLSSHPHQPYGLQPKRSGGVTSKQGFYSGAGTAGSSMSLDHLGPTSGKLDAHSNGTALRNSLFFSPTAGAGMHSSSSGPGQGQAPGSTRNSSTSHLYLPAGYYTSGSAAPAGGHSTTYVGGGRIANPSIFSSLSNLSNLAPQVAGYTRARSMGGPTTPPDSPGLYGYTPQYGYSGRSARQSYMDSPDRGRGAVSVGASGGGGATVRTAALRQGGLYPESRSGSRTPSAYLEDLFEHHGNGMNR